MAEKTRRGPNSPDFPPTFPPLPASLNKSQRVRAPQCLAEAFKTCYLIDSAMVASSRRPQCRFRKTCGLSERIRTRIEGPSSPIRTESIGVGDRRKRQRNWLVDSPDREDPASRLFTYSLALPTFRCSNRYIRDPTAVAHPVATTFPFTSKISLAAVLVKPSF